MGLVGTTVPRSTFLTRPPRGRIGRCISVLRRRRPAVRLGFGLARLSGRQQFQEGGTELAAGIMPPQFLIVARVKHLPASYVDIGNVTPPQHVPHPGLGRRCTFELGHALRLGGSDIDHRQDRERAGESDSDDATSAVHQSRYRGSSRRGRKMGKWAALSWSSDVFADRNRTSRSRAPAAESEPPATPTIELLISILPCRWLVRVAASTAPATTFASSVAPGEADITAPRAWPPHGRSARASA